MKLFRWKIVYLILKPRLEKLKSSIRFQKVNRDVSMVFHNS